MSESQTVQFGFYSAEAEKQVGSFRYRHVDGSTVVVTAVCSDQDYPEYKWADKVNVGLVTEWLGKAKTGSMPKVDFGKR